MNLKKLLDTLGYSDSPNFLRRGTKALETAPDYAHIFRHAEEKPCRLQGVYALRSPEGNGGQIVPIVYVCEADTEQAADELHRLVWNQDIVPFILVYTPYGIKIYSGFRFQAGKRGEASGVLRQLTQFNQISNIVELFQASSIDDGQIWKRWGSKVKPEHRVYWNLLGNLRKLDKWFEGHGLTDKETRHALVGKYVYLHYLRDRDILSPRKFETWGISQASVFGRTATRAGVEAVVDRLDDWLNGSVFPLKLRGAGAPTDDHIQRVAATFAGDAIVGDSSWQLHLDFKAYDFSYIPIETLSMIYEQFLHVPDKENDEGESENDEPTKGRKSGAYYTPIPVVNFMLAELEEHRPLQRGMKVFDPACGSGAFLVQCYRRLIEKEFLARKAKPTPYQLRGLLETSIYGTDYDGDACSVTELSLILTLLDYVEPPDLEDGAYPGFKLPRLRGQTIFQADFFKSKRGLLRDVCRRRFDWVAGNPPWKRLDPNELDEKDRPAWKWMDQNSKRLPIGGNQLAQAFAWECRRYLRPKGECALLMPAMCLFEDPSRRFRASFFEQHRVHTVANFSNLAEVLFAGRSRVPAAAIFFAPRPEGRRPDIDEFVTTFSPLVANQEATRPSESGTRNESWNLVINSSEIRELPLSELTSGSGLPWKLATWGSTWDARLLSRLNRRWPSLEALEERNLLVVSEGLQLRRKATKKSGSETERLEEVKDLGDKEILDVNQLKEYRDIFVFPKHSLKSLDPRLKYVRKGRSKLPLSVCRPPHTLVGAARNFAVYSERYLIVPARQVGIVSPTDDTPVLKALAVFLSSDFAFYHQFLTSTQFGVQRGVATLDALRKIPIPFATATSAELDVWVELHRKLAKLKPRRMQQAGAEQKDLFDTSGDERKGLLVQLNRLVNDVLGLDDRERALVHDLVHVRLGLNDGKLGDNAVGKPGHTDLEAYARFLQRELNDFVGDDMDGHHAVTIVHDDFSGMVEVNFKKDAEVAQSGIKVLPAAGEEAKALEQTRRHLRQERAQWVYFDRNLRIYEGNRTYVLKPMQRFQWTESQAMADASEIITETVASMTGKD